MLVVVTLDAEVFPVAAIRWVIGVVAILVMNRQQVKVPGIELPSALGTNPVMQFQGFLPVVAVLLLLGPHPPHPLIDFGLGEGGYRPAWSSSPAAIHERKAPMSATLPHNVGVALRFSI